MHIFLYKEVIKTRNEVDKVKITEDQGWASIALTMAKQPKESLPIACECGCEHKAAELKLRASTI